MKTTEVIFLWNIITTIMSSILIFNMKTLSYNFIVIFNTWGSATVTTYTRCNR